MAETGQVLGTIDLIWGVLAMAKEQLDSIEREPLLARKNEEPARILAWSSLIFAVLQSLCTALVAMSGVRTLIGASALALSSTNVLLRLHQPSIRVPMLLLSTVGALVDLGVLWQVRRLRKRGASKWRQVPVSSARLRMERLQLLLSALALCLVVAELTAHKHLHGVFF